MKTPIILCVLLSAASAEAKCVVQSEASPESDCVVMPLNGKRGIWFGLETADELRLSHMQVPLLVQQNLDYATALELSKSASADYLAAYNAKASSLRDALAANEVLEAKARRAREQQESWTRSPLLWTGVGIVGTLAGFLIFSYASGN